MKSELECWSERMCIHVGFYMIQYMRLCQVRWCSLPPQLDLSPCARVYVRGGRWVGHLFEFQPVRSDTNLQIPIKRSLDLFWLMCWISYLGFRYDMWRISHLLGSDVSRYLLKRFGRSWWCLSVTVIHQRLAIQRSVPLSDTWITMAYDTRPHK